MSSFNLPFGRAAHLVLISRLTQRVVGVSSSAFVIGILATPSLVFAQVPPPPPPLPPSEEESAALDDPNATGERTDPTETEGQEEVVAEDQGSGPPDADPQPESGDTTQQEVDPFIDPTANDPNAADEPPAEEWFRLDASRRQSTLSGSTGLFRVKEAGSGAAGTFRIQLMGGYYSGKGFLCSDTFPCFDPASGEATLSDKAQRSSALLNISVTPFSFLEAFLTLENSATYNSEGTPQSIQVVGDANFGLKGFLPQKPDRIYSFGGEMDVHLMTGMGGVGVASGATSVGLTALGTLDLNNRSLKKDRIPLRAHFNLGYYFDNSAKLIANLEETPPPEGRGARVSRIERYGLGISRVDSLQLGLGTEYVHDYFRPFLEWTLDIPVNRQGYECVITDTVNDRTATADMCLKLAAGLPTTPSRLTFGTRVFPWQATGLALSLGADIGTGGAHRFLDETRPETPYTIWFGVGYTVDVAPKKLQDETATAPTLAVAPETRRYVMGRVIDEATGNVVPDAIIRYKDVPMTGLIANTEGLFISQDLPQGEYVFSIHANGYKDGVCSVAIPESAPSPATEASTDEPSAALADAEVGAATESTVVQSDSTAPYLDEDGNVLVPLDCKLSELPQVTNITGLLVDGRNGGPVLDATVTIVDKLDRSLSLEVDAAGAFQFRNVPFGSARLRATAPGYLPTVHPINVASREELKAHVLMNPRPKRLGVTVTKTEIKLNRPIEFVGDTVALVLDSAAMIEELAVALADDTTSGVIEIQVHTDDSGAASYSRRLSQERADHIRELLIDLGVLPRLLKAKGYGPDQPLTPNVSDESRSKNNRVQFILVKE